MTRPRWWARAACKAAGPSLFFDEGLELAAKEVCSGCMVRRECLADALATPERDDRDGVFGGLTAPERKLMRRGTVSRVSDKGGAA